MSGSMALTPGHLNINKVLLLFCSMYMNSLHWVTRIVFTIYIPGEEYGMACIILH